MANPDVPPGALPPPDVGSAYMQPDGTLELRLRAETEDGTIGEALLVIAPGDPRHASMVAHLGGIQPGQGCAIPPFPAPEAP